MATQVAATAELQVAGGASEPARVAPPRAHVGGSPRTALALLLLPGALIVFMGFNAGGYFPSAPATGAIVLALALLVRIVGARHPFEGFAPATVIASSALAAYAGFT